jgi:hypothetical protein
MRQTQMYQRLLLLYLLDLRSSPTVLPSLLSHPVETMQAHQKYTLSRLQPATVRKFAFVYTSGGPGGIRTPVQNAFTLKELQQFLKLAECC